MADENNPLLPLTPPPDGGDGGGPTGAASIVPINIEQEMQRSYLDYAMSVIIGRALPDVRDGLKPVHRRILYGMHDMGMFHNKKHSKCAGVVGELLKKYHPHGDGAVYDALVRLAQSWTLRYPLVDGQGNFGSVDGDPAAAYRYTECRMAAIAEELLADIDKDAVDFVENFDNTTVEPVVLPTRIPNLLVNGSDGIAVGMATKIPPHNLTEITNACIELLNHPNATLDDLLVHVQGPDFPTAGFIYGRSGIRAAYEHGRGRFLMRARAAVENINKERQAIIVTEIPYQVNKARLIEKIAELVNDKVIDDISDIRDESDRDGMRIVIELKRGAQPEIVLNQLYKNTQLQDSFSMIFLAVANGRPLEMGLVQAVRFFIDHRRDVVRRRTAFLLGKARDREHILEGYQIAVDRLDDVISIIRGSGNRTEARDNLVAYFGGRPIEVSPNGRPTRVTFDRRLERPFDNRQADAILELQLHRLTRLSIDEIVSELREVRDRIADYEAILASDKRVRSVVIKELEEIRDKYGDARRTQILDETVEIKLEDLIADEQVAVTVSHNGYLKRTNVSIYRSQRRGGSGRRGMSTREDDFVEQLFMASTHDYMLIFTNTGRVFWLKVYEIPDVGAAGKGKHVGNLVALQPGEAPRAMLAVPSLEETGKYIFFATRKGTVKKTALVDFSNVMSRGIIAINIDKDDELVSAAISNGDDIVFLASHEGMAIRFEEKYAEGHNGGVRPMGRNAGGVRGMDLEDGDYIVGMAITPRPDPDAPLKVKKAKKDTSDAAKALADKILTVTENGYGKRTGLDEYRLQSRGGKGVINVRTSTRNGKVVGVLLVSENSEGMVISQYGQIIRIPTDQVRQAGRATQGVRLLSLDPGDRVAAAVIIPEEDAPEENGSLIH